MKYPVSRAVALQLFGGKFTNGDAGSGIPASLDDAITYNSLIDEVINVITAGGLTPNENLSNQLVAAIAALIGRASGNLRGWHPINDANYEVTPDDFGKYVVLNTGSTADRTFTLEDGVNPGDQVAFANLSSSGFALNIQVKPPSSALFFASAPGMAGVATFAMAGGDEVVCTWNGLFWHIGYMSADYLRPGKNLSDLTNIGSALATLTFGSANGVIKLPNFQNLANPVIFQWGGGTLPNSAAAQSTQAITFNQTFPNQVSNVFGNARGTTGTGSWVPVIGKASAPTAAGATFKGDLLGAGIFNSTVAYDWFAIGG